MKYLDTNEMTFDKIVDRAKNKQKMILKNA